MSTSLERPLIAELRHGLHALRGNWFWFVILFVGINLVFRGFYWIALGLALRSLPRPATP